MAIDNQTAHALPIEERAKGGAARPGARGTRQAESAGGRIWKCLVWGVMAFWRRW